MYTCWNMQSTWFNPPSTDFSSISEYRRPIWSTCGKYGDRLWPVYPDMDGTAPNIPLPYWFDDDFLDWTDELPVMLMFWTDMDLPWWTEPKRVGSGPGRLAWSQLIACAWLFQAGRELAVEGTAPKLSGGMGTDACPVMARRGTLGCWSRWEVEEENGDRKPFAPTAPEEFWSPAVEVVQSSPLDWRRSPSTGGQPAYAADDAGGTAGRVVSADESASRPSEDTTAFRPASFCWRSGASTGLALNAFSGRASDSGVLGRVHPWWTAGDFSAQVASCI